MKRLLIATTLLGLALSLPLSSRHTASAAETGQAVFDANCAQCHNATSADTKIGPGLKGLFKNPKLPSSGRPATVANVTAQIKNGGRGMPGFGGTLAAGDIAALVGYLKTL